MRDLFLQVIHLLRRYPILWLPVALAEFLNFNILHLDGILRRELTDAILPPLSQYASVLSGALERGPISAQTMAKSRIFAVSLHWSAEFLCILLSAAVLVATAQILRRINETEDTRFAATLPAVVSSKRKVLVFSAKILGISIVAFTLIDLLPPLYLPLSNALQGAFEKTFSLSLKSSLTLEHLDLFGNLLSRLWVLPITLCVVYIVAPLQLGLLLSSPLAARSGQIKQARQAAILTVIVMCFSGVVTAIVIYPVFGLSLPRTPFTDYCALAVAHVVTTLPYVPFYIALALIAGVPPPSISTPSANENSSAQTDTPNSDL